jgi:predicted AAA+ superfamily ATPase
MPEPRIEELVKHYMALEVPEPVPRELRFQFPEPKRCATIIGPRRAGKTYFLYQRLRELRSREGTGPTFHINLEDDRLVPSDVTTLDAIWRAFREARPAVKGSTTHVFLDEVQAIDGWERFVRRIIDTEDVQVYLTGSSSRLLSTEIATVMRGRSLTFTLLPFSFREALRARGLDIGPEPSYDQRATALRELGDYMTYGGFPEVVLLRDAGARVGTLREYVELMLMRDVVERHGIRNIALVRRLLNDLLSSIGAEFSVNKYRNHLSSMGIKASKNTLYEYIGHLEDAFIIHPLRAYNRSRRERSRSLPKVYPIDPGLSLQAGGRPFQDLGRRMECVAALELMRRCLDEPLSEVLYWRDPFGKEVDFVVLQGGEVAQLVQCCYDVSELGTRERELGALLKASGELGCDDLLVLTWDHEGEEAVEGRRVVFEPLWKWLLRPPAHTRLAAMGTVREAMIGTALHAMKIGTPTGRRVGGKR